MSLSEENSESSESILGKRILESQSEEHNRAKRQLTECKVVKREIGSHFVPTGPFFNGIASDQGVTFDGIFEDNRLLLNAENIFERIIEQTGTLNAQRFTGSVKYQDGQVNEGIFEDGFLIEGTKSFPDGIVYEGIFSSGLLTKGKCIFPNGEVQEGLFNYGFLSLGKIIKDGKVRVSGEFKDGDLVKGFEYWDDGTLERGDFYKGLLSDGVRYYADGDIETGFFAESGVLESGKRFKADTQCFEEGEFEEGMLVEGNIKFTNGDIFRGTFENAVLREGDVSFANGETMTGIFNRFGELVDGEYRISSGEVIEVRFKED